MPLRVMRDTVTGMWWHVVTSMWWHVVAAASLSSCGGVQALLKLVTDTHKLPHAPAVRLSAIETLKVSETVSPPP
jgi:hypothetical protein